MAFYMKQEKKNYQSPDTCVVPVSMSTIILNSKDGEMDNGGFLNE